MSNLLQKSWSISSQLLIEEAKNLGFESEILCRDKNLFIIRSNTKELLFKNNDFGGNSSLAKKIVDDKELSHIMLERWNLPIAKSLHIDGADFREMDGDILQDWKYPLVIKPIDGAHGNGVCMGILDSIELLEKLKKSFEKYPRMIIQEQIAGDECRCVVMFGELILAINRVPPSIVGDGTQTVSELIESENQTNPLRADGYDSALSYILVDDELHDHISKQGKSLTSVLVSGETLQLRGNSNIGTGGTIRDLTHTVHPDIRDLCTNIAKKLDMDLLCVDIISPDFSRPISETGAVILEIGGNPGFGGHREFTSVNTY